MALTVWPQIINVLSRTGRPSNVLIEKTNMQHLVLLEMAFGSAPNVVERNKPPGMKTKECKGDSVRGPPRDASAFSSYHLSSSKGQRPMAYQPMALPWAAANAGSEGRAEGLTHRWEVNVPGLQPSTNAVPPLPMTLPWVGMRPDLRPSKAPHGVGTHGSYRRSDTYRTGMYRTDTWRIHILSPLHICLQAPSQHGPGPVPIKPW